MSRANAKDPRHPLPCIGCPLGVDGKGYDSDTENEARVFCCGGWIRVSQARECSWKLFPALTALINSVRPALVIGALE